jgi:hypothetical protein
MMRTAMRQPDGLYYMHSDEDRKASERRIMPTSANEDENVRLSDGKPHVRGDDVGEQGG